MEGVVEDAINVSFNVTIPISSRTSPSSPSSSSSSTASATGVVVPHQPPLSSLSPFAPPPPPSLARHHHQHRLGLSSAHAPAFTPAAASPSSSSSTASTSTSSSSSLARTSLGATPDLPASAPANAGPGAHTRALPSNDDIEAAIQAAMTSSSVGGSGSASASNGTGERGIGSNGGGGDGRTVPPRDTRTQLFVGNLPYRVRWQDLKDLFRRAGTVLRADVSLGPDNRSRGYGTVLLATAEDAGRAIDMFNGYDWQTRVLEVRVDRIGGPMTFDAPAAGVHGSAMGVGAGGGVQTGMAMGAVGGGGGMGAASGIGAMMGLNAGVYGVPGQFVAQRSQQQYFGQAQIPGQQQQGQHIFPSPQLQLQLQAQVQKLQGQQQLQQQHAFSPRGLSTSLTPQTQLSLGQLQQVQVQALGQGQGQDQVQGYYERQQQQQQLLQQLQLQQILQPTQYTQTIAAGSTGVPGRTLFVGNLPYHVQWQDLKDLFRRMPPNIPPSVSGGMSANQSFNIQRADVALGPDGRSKGFGTATFSSIEEAERARRVFNGYDFNGRQLKVHYDRIPAAPLGSGSSSSTPSPALPSSSLNALSPPVSSLTQQMLSLSLNGFPPQQRQSHSPSISQALLNHDVAALGHPRDHPRSVSPSFSLLPLKQGSPSSSLSPSSSALGRMGLLSEAAAGSTSSPVLGSYGSPSPRLRHTQTHGSGSLGSTLAAPVPTMATTMRDSRARSGSNLRSEFDFGEGGDGKGRGESVPVSASVARQYQQYSTASASSVSPGLSKNPSGPIEITLPVPSFSFDFDPSVVSHDATSGYDSVSGYEGDREEQHQQRARGALREISTSTSRRGEERREHSEHQLYQLLHGSRQVASSGTPRTSGALSPSQLGQALQQHSHSLERNNDSPAYPPPFASSVASSASTASSAGSAFDHFQGFKHGKFEGGDVPEEEVLENLPRLRSQRSGGAGVQSAYPSSDGESGISSAAASTRSLPLNLGFPARSSRTRAQMQSPLPEGLVYPKDFLQTSQSASYSQVVAAAGGGHRPLSTISTTGSTTSASESGLSTSVSMSGSSRTGSSAPPATANDVDLNPEGERGDGPATRPASAASGSDSFHAQREKERERLRNMTIRRTAGVTSQGGTDLQKSDRQHPGPIELPPPPQILAPVSITPQVAKKGSSVHSIFGTFNSSSAESCSSRTGSGLAVTKLGELGDGLFQQYHPFAGKEECDYYSGIPTVRAKPPVMPENERGVSKARGEERRRRAYEDEIARRTEQEGAEEDEEEQRRSQYQMQWQLQQQQYLQLQKLQQQCFPSQITPVTPHGLPAITPSMPPFTFVGTQASLGSSVQHVTTPTSHLQVKQQQRVQQQQREQPIIGTSDGILHPNGTKGRQHPNAPGMLSLPPPPAQLQLLSHSQLHQQHPPQSPTTTAPTASAAPYLHPLGSPGSPYALGPHHPLHRQYQLQLQQQYQYQYSHPSQHQPSYSYGGSHGPHPLAQSFASGGRTSSPAGGQVEEGQHPQQQQPHSIGHNPYSIVLPSNIQQMMPLGSPGGTPAGFGLGAMSPGAFWGRPGEMSVANPFMNPAVGAPVRLVAGLNGTVRSQGQAAAVDADDSGRRQESSDADGSYHPSGTYWPYGPGMATVEPKGYFDQLYMNPAGYGLGVEGGVNGDSGGGAEVKETDVGGVSIGEMDDESRSKSLIEREILRDRTEDVSNGAGAMQGKTAGPPLLASSSSQSTRGSGTSLSMGSPETTLTSDEDHDGDGLGDGDGEREWGNHNDETTNGKPVLRAIGGSALVGVERIGASDVPLQLQHANTEPVTSRR